MILINCNCGCFYTLKEQGFTNTDDINCPNCKKIHKLSSYESIRSMAMASLEENGIEIKCIPDNSKITFSFDM